MSVSRGGAIARALAWSLGSSGLDKNFINPIETTILLFVCVEDTNTRENGTVKMIRRAFFFFFEHGGSNGAPIYLVKGR